MNIRSIVLAVQYICILGVFTEIAIIARRWKNSLHIYLLLSCIALFINSVGYLLELTSTTEEGFITALKYSYLGRTWFGLLLFMFVLSLTKKIPPKGLLVVPAVIHAFIYCVVFNFENNRLYYESYSFSNEGIFPVFAHEDGILHHFFMALQICYIIVGLYQLIRAYIKRGKGRAGRRLILVILAVISESIFFIIQIADIIPVTEYYDVTMIGYFIGTILMLVAILSFDLLGTKEIAREFVIDRISEGIIAVDNEGVIQYINEPAKRLYPEINEAEPGASVVPGEILRAAGEDTTITKYDRIYSVEENDLKYGGEILGKLYALVDDTDHFRYMEELEKQKKRADSANEAKSRFLASMSHEIRTPINAVLGLDEMILRETGEKETRSYASNIMSAGRTLLSLINDILDLSKVEEGKMEIIPVQYELSSLINDLVNMTRSRAENKGLRFTTEVDGSIPHLLIGDEIRIRQCVMNLLTNAVKYTEKGSVTLRVYHDRGEDKGTNDRTDNMGDKSYISLGFSVEDTGIGMKTEDIDKLFSPYERFEEERNRSIEGTGLGMSITRQLLDLMGTALDVSSEYGKGTTVSFSVKQEVVSWDEIGDYNDRACSPGGSNGEYHELFHAPDGHILVVDDTEMNLTVMEGLLKKTKLRIDTASSGKEAIELAENNSYDVVFIDHMMPDMDGIETLKAIRLHGSNTDIPAVALTANAVSGAREMYLEAGFTDYMSKPVDGIKLEKMLMSLLPSDKVMEPVDSSVSDVDKTMVDNDNDGAEGHDNGLPGWLTGIEGMDTSAGMANCGSNDSYLSALKVFHKTAGAKADEIEGLFKSGDIPGYTIKVHALKSSARIIGAAQLSQLAGRLEEAGNDNDIDFIKDNTDTLLDMFRELDGKLSPLGLRTEPLKEMDPAVREDAYRTMAEIADSMDYDLMECILMNIREYSLTSEDEECIKEVESCLARLDWDGIKQAVQGKRV